MLKIIHKQQSFENPHDELALKISHMGMQYKWNNKYDQQCFGNPHDESKLIVVYEVSPESSVADAAPARCNPSLLVHLVKGVIGQPKQLFTFHLTMKSFWIVMFVSGDKHQMLFASAIVVFDLI